MPKRPSSNDPAAKFTWPTRANVLGALKNERAATPIPPPLKIGGVIPQTEESIWRVSLDWGAKSARWNDLNEGMRVSWGEAGAGGEILEIHPEQNQVVLGSESEDAPEPRSGENLTIENMDFLAPLESLWSDDTWAAAIEKTCRSPEPSPASAFPGAPRNPESWFPWLRPGQVQAFSLLDQRHGFLWGPAGTGKTRTVGAMVAAWLEQNPGKRVLLVATTNPAVDHLLVAVDEALAERGFGTQGDSPRIACRRIGRQADRRRYDKRTHLLPRFSKKRESRPAVLQSFTHARALGLTTARLLMEAPLVRELSHGFDLLVLDEASQLPLAHALALLPLAPQGLYAGDPAQLGPVVRTSDKVARTVLESSLFDARAELGASSRTVLLAEQSRMAGPICEVVGSRFYESRLRVCARAAADIDWQARRQSARGPRPALEIIPVENQGRYSKSRGGPIREASVAAVVAHVKLLLATTPLKPGDILVLTPFRAQQGLLRDALAEAQVGGVRVSTVHRAQGSERLAVLFDPVDGRSGFLRGVAGNRLVNVAFSRAEAHLAIFLGPKDNTNQLFEFCAQ
jgi:hypothetical protein